MRLKEIAGELSLLLRANSQIVQIVSYEEDRVESLCREVAEDLGCKCFSWSLNKGLRAPKPSRRTSKDFAIARHPEDTLKHIENYEFEDIFLLKDFYLHWEERSLARRLKDLVLADLPAKVIISSSTLIQNEYLERFIKPLSLPFPCEQELFAELKRRAHAFNKSKKTAVSMSNQEGRELSRAVLGLTMREARGVYNKAFHRDGQLRRNDIDFALKEKARYFKNRRALELYEARGTMGEIGGLKGLKHWLRKRRESLSDKARSFGIQAPKGILLVGVPGCGKSLAAKTVGVEWKLPTVKLDMGAIYSGLVGSSEENMREALKSAETLSPCILWVDEIEKAMATSSAGSDGGVSQRVLGTLLNWMQERREATFVVATANKVDRLPHELLRKGRFDEIFFVDLPNEMARREIWTIHLKKTHRDAGAFDLDKLVSLSQGMSGSEIEACLADALVEAFSAKRPLFEKDIWRALDHCVPLSQSRAESVADIRQWAKNRCRSADLDFEPEQFLKKIA